MICVHADRFRIYAITRDTHIVSLIGTTTSLKTSRRLRAKRAHFIIFLRWLKRTHYYCEFCSTRREYCMSSRSSRETFLISFCLCLFRRAICKDESPQSRCGMAVLCVCACVWCSWWGNCTNIMVQQTYVWLRVESGRSAQSVCVWMYSRQLPNGEEHFYLTIIG